MSADNGIYIGCFPTENGKEYRVAEAAAIENCTDYEPKDVYQVLYFGDARVFGTSEEAWAYANEYSKEFDILEYGVSEIEFNEPLPKMSRAEAEKKLDRFYQNITSKKTFLRLVK